MYFLLSSGLSKVFKIFSYFHLYTIFIFHYFFMIRIIKLAITIDMKIIFFFSNSNICCNFNLSLHFEASLHGGTVVRPVFFEFPNDTETYDLGYQFMWGAAMMIIPVVHQVNIFKKKFYNIEVYFGKKRVPL